MTKDTALRMAIDALCRAWDTEEYWKTMTSALQACKEALAETQEPVARINLNKRRLEFVIPMDWSNLSTVAYLPDIPLYTTPPSREWQSLSDWDYVEIYGHASLVDWRFARAIEAKLREKNNG